MCTGFQLLASQQSVLTNHPASPRQKISVKDQNVVLLSNEEDVLGRWREYFKDVSNPTTLTPSNTQEVRLARKGPSLQLRSS